MFVKYINNSIFLGLGVRGRVTSPLGKDLVFPLEGPCTIFYLSSLGGAAETKILNYVSLLAWFLAWFEPGHLGSRRARRPFYYHEADLEMRLLQRHVLFRLELFGTGITTESASRFQLLNGRCEEKRKLWIAARWYISRLPRHSFVEKYRNYIQLAHLFSIYTLCW